MTKEELINENEEMKSGLGCETCQIHLEFINLNKQIKELTKSNLNVRSELRNKRNDYEVIDTHYKVAMERIAELKAQIEKAKYIINEFTRISVASIEEYEPEFSELIGEVETFLKVK